MKCPRCKINELHPEEAMNALSREDNKTYICSDCGTVEAMDAFNKYLTSKKQGESHDERS